MAARAAGRLEKVAMARPWGFGFGFGVVVEVDVEGGVH
jgi:hypothetical protein